jgi:hypothetical protein
LILLYSSFGSSSHTTCLSFSIICTSVIVLIRFSFIPSPFFSSAAAAAATPCGPVFSPAFSSNWIAGFLAGCSGFTGGGPVVAPAAVDDAAFATGAVLLGGPSGGRC